MPQDSNNSEVRACVEIAKSIYHTMLTIYDIDEVILSGEFDEEAPRLTDVRRRELDSLRDMQEIFNKCLV